VNGDLVGKTCELAWKALDSLDQERGVRDAGSLRAPRATREGVGARVDGHCESAWIGQRAVQDVAAVAGADIDEDVAERGG
jgi:hypothetical protein